MMKGALSMGKLSDVLLVIDLQNGVCQGEQTCYQLQEVINQVNHRIAKYKEHQKVVIFVQHNDEELVAGTTPWEIIKELESEWATYFIQKNTPILSLIQI